MIDDAAAQAPATEEVVETSQIETPEPTEDDILSEAFDRLNQEEPEQKEENVEATPEPDEQATEPAPSVEVPTDLPGDLKSLWPDLPEAARDTILNSHRSLSAKYSQAMRDAQGIGPIRDSLVRAAQEIPHLKNMTPQQVANDVFNLAKAAQALNADPKKAIMDLAKQHGVDLSGQPPSDAGKTITGLQQEIAGLKQQLQAQLDPNRMQENFKAWSDQQSIAATVSDFASTQQHWAQVEQHLPTVIPLAQAKLGPNADAKSVLQEAYNLAINTFVPDARAAQQAGDEPAPQAPQRVKAAVKAKSVNVQSKPSTNSRPQSEDEVLAQAWDRMNKS